MYSLYGEEGPRLTVSEYDEERRFYPSLAEIEADTDNIEVGSFCLDLNKNVYRKEQDGSFRHLLTLNDIILEIKSPNLFYDEEGTQTLKDFLFSDLTEDMFKEVYNEQ